MAKRETTVPISSASRRIVPLLLFGSGFCALVYQTTWLREFRLIFGGSTAATAAVLGIFMSGLGVGGIVLGRRCETKARPLAFYGRLELFIAASAVMSLLLIVVARSFYIALGGTSTMGMLGGTIVRLVLAAIILGTPTFLMGGTLPAAVRAFVGRDDVARRSVGILYGVNTLGAVSGALAGTFYCFEHLGNRTTLLLAAILNVLVALVALRIGNSMTESTRDDERSRKPDEDGSHVAVSPIFVLSSAALVGFAFLLMEIVWYRMLAPLLGGSTYSFGLILAVALFGIGLGGAAYAVFGLKRSASLQFFALTCGAEAFFVALPYALGDRIALAAMLLRPMGTLGFHGHVIAWTSLCLIVVFPAAFVSGLQFPLLIALLGKGRTLVGSQTGAAYAWNTAGALAGSLAGGFGFIPLFSAPVVWKLVVIVLALLAIVAAVLALREQWRWLRMSIALATVAVALCMLAASGPTAFWRHSEIGVGRVHQTDAPPNELRDLINRLRNRNLWEADGIESSVALTKNGFSFIVNGRSDGSAKIDAGTQVTCGLIGAALHPHLRKAMVIGLGTGSSAGWLAAIPSIEKVDVAELEPVILRVAKDCAPVNHNALSNPKLHVTIGDAREFLLTTREKYDLIVSEPSNPYRAGVAGLFTREYYHSVDRCLAPGGLFLQWMQAYEVDESTIEVFCRTLGSVFANIECWETEAGDLLLIASHEPNRYDADMLRARLAEEPFKSGLLAGWRAEGLEDFLGHYVGNQNVTRTLQQFQPGPINTDDRTVIEFALARSVNLSHNGFRIDDLRLSAHAAHADRPRIQNGAIDWSAVEEARSLLYGFRNSAEKIQLGLTEDQRNRVDAYASFLANDLPGALRHWRAQLEEPKNLTELLMVAECLADAGDPAATPYIDKLSQLLPSDAEAIRAHLAWKEQKPVEAIDSYLKFFRALHEDPWPADELIRRSILRAEAIARSNLSHEGTLLLYNALRAPLCLYNNDTDRIGTLLTIGFYLDGNKAGAYTLPALEALEPNFPFERNFLEARKDCYERLHDPRVEQARRDLDDFMKHESATANVSALAREIETTSERTSLGPND
ncbi:MAG: spermidine synthase [Verrucomicrobiota bacterium]|jgi:predicted membrane-bound spermidine synthase